MRDCVGVERQLGYRVNGREGEGRTSVIWEGVYWLWAIPGSAETASAMSAHREGAGLSLRRAKLPNWRRPSW